ncbi:MAG: hypothetical protein ABSF12_22800 [Bryobacteraceae bacterium]|jgi:hypothetical protein
MIQEGGLAGNAKIIRVKGRGFMQAFPAYGDAGNFVEGLAADAAIIGEKTAERLFCERQNRATEIGQQGT